MGGHGRLIPLLALACTERNVKEVSTVYSYKILICLTTLSMLLKTWAKSHKGLYIQSCYHLSQNFYVTNPSQIICCFSRSAIEMNLSISCTTSHSPSPPSPSAQQCTPPSPPAHTKHPSPPTPPSPPQSAPPVAPHTDHACPSPPACPSSHHT